MRTMGFSASAFGIAPNNGQQIPPPGPNAMKAPYGVHCNKWGCYPNPKPEPWTKTDTCHAAAIAGLVGLVTVPEVEIPAAIAWTLYGVGGASAIAGVTYCW